MNTVLAEDTFTLTMSSIVRYAGASGDFTPIHYDPDALAAAGYDNFFAMGMLTAGRLGALVSTTFGDGSIRHLRVRFRERAWVGSLVTLSIFADPTATEPDVIGVLLRASTHHDQVIADGDAIIERSTTTREVSA